MSTYKYENINDRPPQLVDLGFWAQIRFDATDVAPTYIGLNNSATAATTATDWKVYRFYYDGATTNITRIQFLYGTWDGRAALSW